MPKMPDQANPGILDLALFGSMDHVLLSEDKSENLWVGLLAVMFIESINWGTALLQKRVY